MDTEDILKFATNNANNSALCVAGRYEYTGGAHNCARIYLREAKQRIDEIHEFFSDEDGNRSKYASDEKPSELKFLEKAIKEAEYAIKQWESMKPANYGR